MKKTISFSILLIFLVVILVDLVPSFTENTAQAGKFGDSCKGNACNDVRFQFDGCFNTKNLGDKRIKVKLGPWSFMLQRGETHVLKINNQCVTSFMGGVFANYVN